MTKYKVVLELEVEEIQQPPLTPDEVLASLVIIPGNDIESIENINKRIWEKKPVFEMPCRFGDTCTNKELYEDCIQDERVRSSWMCWRDGILKETQSLQGSVSE